MHDYCYWIVLTDDGCVHKRVYATSKWAAMRKVETRNYCRVRATDAWRA